MSMRTLRGLSRAYASGTIDRETYRRQRRELLQQIVTGEFPVLPFQPPTPEARTVFPYADDDGDTTQEIIAPVEPARRPSGGRGGSRMRVILFLGLGLGAAWYALHDVADGEPPAAGAVEQRSPSALAIIDDFLAAGIWNAASMNALIAAWDLLDAGAREGLRRSESMRRLKEAVLERFQAERALMQLGDDEDALDSQGRLIAFAAHLGLDDDRLARARVQWVEAQALHTARREVALREAQPNTALVVAEGAPAPPVAEPVAGSVAAPVAEPVAKPVAESVTAPVVESVAKPVAESVTAPVAESVAKPVAESVAAAVAEPAVQPGSAPATDHETPPPSPATELAGSPPAAATPTAAAPQRAERQEPVRRSTCTADLVKSRRPYCIDVMVSGGKGPILVVLPPGRFEMGGEQAEEQPRHEVTIAKAFAMSMFEVSAAEFAAYCEASGSACPAQPWPDPALPAVNVSWQLANAYAAWLSQATGATYRLPTEAEWEYAARAGSTTAYPFGAELVPTHAHYSFMSDQTSPLAAHDRSINRNRFRLYHMIGNVREWVLDPWAPDYAGAPVDGSARAGGGEYVVRGGSFADSGAALRSAARQSLPADAADRYTGFRVVRVIGELQ